jgi:hypothetical protein
MALSGRSLSRTGPPWGTDVSPEIGRRATRCSNTWLVDGGGFTGVVVGVETVVIVTVARRIIVLAVFAGSALVAVPAAALAATTYYVSPSGSDSNSGVAPSAPWRTLGKVSATALGPGDRMLLQGGQTFTGELDLQGSGVPGNPAVYASYGAGKAVINGLVYPSAQHDVTLSNLIVDRGVHSPGGGDCIASAYSTSGVIDLVIDSVEVRNCDRGILSSQHNDANWTIENSYVHDTVDSGMILWGSNLVVKDNSIEHTGVVQQSFDAHGIYSKSSGIQILRNDIGSFQTDGVSTRVRNALIEGNTIHDSTRGSCCSTGIGYYNYDSSEASGQGTTTVRYNRLWNIAGNGIYVDPGVPGATTGSPENWRIYNNTFSGSGGGNYAMYLSVMGTGGLHATEVTIRNNLVTGWGSGMLSMPTGRPATYNQDHNDWNGSGAPSGRGDMTSSPNMSAAPAFAPRSGSAVIDAGTTSIRGATFTAACDGRALHYCGSAPDIGAVETGTRLRSAVRAHSARHSHRRQHHRRKRSRHHHVGHTHHHVRKHR